MVYKKFFMYALALAIANLQARVVTLQNSSKNRDLGVVFYSDDTPELKNQILRPEERVEIHTEINADIPIYCPDNSGFGPVYLDTSKAAESSFIELQCTTNLNTGETIIQDAKNKKMYSSDSTIVL